MVPRNSIQHCCMDTAAAYLLRNTCTLVSHHTIIVSFATAMRVVLRPSKKLTTAANECYRKDLMDNKQASQNQHPDFPPPASTNPRTNPLPFPAFSKEEAVHKNPPSKHVVGLKMLRACSEAEKAWWYYCSIPPSASTRGVTVPSRSHCNSTFFHFFPSSQTNCCCDHPCAVPYRKGQVLPPRTCTESPEENS